MKRARLLGVGLVLAATVTATGRPISAATPPPNLLKNPRAEAKPGGTGQPVNTPGWYRVHNTSFTAVKYGSAGFPSKTSPGPNDRGKNFFAGGPSTGATIIAQQSLIDLAKWKLAIDNDAAVFTAGGWFGGKGAEKDQARLEIRFYDDDFNLLGTVTKIGPVTPAERGNKTRLMYRHVDNQYIPVGARQAFVTAFFDRFNGNYNDGYMDNTLFSIRAL